MYRRPGAHKAKAAPARWLAGRGGRPAGDRRGWLERENGNARPSGGGEAVAVAAAAVVAGERQRGHERHVQSLPRSSVHACLLLVSACLPHHETRDIPRPTVYRRDSTRDCTDAVAAAAAAATATIRQIRLSVSEDAMIGVMLVLRPCRGTRISMWDARDARRDGTPCLSYSKRLLFPIDLKCARKCDRSLRFFRSR